MSTWSKQWAVGSRRPRGVGLVVAFALVVLLSARGAFAGGLSVSPSAATVAPLGTQQFTASGGSGMGYLWALTSATSGGSISSTGLYTAGNIGNSTDQVQLTDSMLNTTTAVVTVTGGITITPSSATLAPKDSQQFVGTGGKMPYTWALVTDGSGGATISMTSGLYTAGTKIGTDVISIHDSLGASITATITIESNVPNGTACTESGTCTSGHCVDGVCCNTACSGQCQACNATGAIGTCSTISGPAVGTRSACPQADKSNPCSQMACDGTNPNACTVFVGPSVMCVSASCVDQIGTPASMCDGDGGCPTVVATSCAPFACVAGACASSCNDTSECSPGNYCDVTSGLCVVPDGGSVFGDAGTQQLGGAPKSSSGCVAGGEGGADWTEVGAVLLSMLGLFGVVRRRERGRKNA